MKLKVTSDPGSTKKNKTGGWRTFKPITDMEKCIGCGMCSRVCPEGIVSMVKAGDKQKPKTDYDYCKGCGICANECPVGAIKMELEKK